MNKCFCRCCNNNQKYCLTLDDMLLEYSYSFASNMSKCIAAYKEIETQNYWEDVTKAICPCCKRKFLHQKRIPISVLEQWSNHILQKQQEISNCSDFEDLYNCIKNIKEKGEIKGIGELTVYDTAFRLGIHLDKLPSDKVYLHANAVIPGYTKLFIPAKKLVDNFYKHNMSAYMIEDFLCVFHKNITEQSHKISIIKPGIN